MAMVLDAFSSYVQNMLMEMANEEVGMLLGVSHEINKMGITLEDLKRFLADADRRNITDKSVQEWVGQLKRAMYDATDILDLCQLKVMEQGRPSTLDLGCFNPLLFCLRNPLHAHDIGSRIKAVNQKLDDIKERSAAFNFINLSSYRDRSSRIQASRPGDPNRETSGELDRSGVVGEKIEEDTKALVEILLSEKEGSNNIMMVAIVGVGGIGKTTLAQKVFNEEALNAKFDKTIWLSINQNFDKVELLRTAITLAGGDHHGEMALAVLRPILTAALTGKKLLLVMDDVWSHGAWGDVLETPLVNAVARGSRVLLTTRDGRVARGMKAVPPYHHIDKLEEEDAWALLKKQIISSETDISKIDMLKDIGLQIVAKCGGLPLAVKVMGGLLCQKEKQRREWEMVLNDSMWSISEMPEELNYAIYLSYADLAPCLKQCYLYYSLLPKTAMFYREEIIAMWISEGFLHGTSDDLEELGIKYYKELILRNLIEPNSFYIDQRVCNMHDVVRSFAQFLASDETLAAHSGEASIISKPTAQKFLRLSLESKVSESNELDWSSLKVQKKLRTLISVGHINVKPGDSLVNFPCLRTLYIDCANVAVLIESLDQLKHLRYLSIKSCDISSLPDSIGKMKFLQYIFLNGCQQFVKLPQSIVKLEQLRCLSISETSINDIPRGFSVLTNLRELHGFPTRVDGDWCSLEELGPLSHLKCLGLLRLENVSATSFAAKARLGEKMHLTKLYLTCSSRLGDDGLVKEEENISEKEQQRIKEVLDELCPPSSLDNLDINGYFGQRLPKWMMSTSASSLQTLRILFMTNLACCIQLPDGLSQLPCLEFIQISRAPSIKHIGPKFLQPYHHHPSQLAPAAFVRLHELNLFEMVEWEVWEWEEQVQAMPVLENLLLGSCKLRCIPLGLACNARALKKLDVQYVQHLRYLENFASVEDLVVTKNPNLERITNFPNLQRLEIHTCPNLKVLEGVRALHRLGLEDYTMETLPEYMLSDVNPRHLDLRCHLALLTSIAVGQSSPDWDKFSHVEHFKAYACDRNNPRKWYVLYTREPYNLDTNISRSFLSEGTLLYSMVDAQGFDHVFKMRRTTFSYICNLVNDDMMVRDSSCTFLDGRVLSLEDRVAVALIALNSGEPMASLGSSVGANGSTVTLVAERFVVALSERPDDHMCWPNSNEMDKIKSKFDKIQGLPNCCGVAHTSHITFGRSCNHEKNGSILMQAVIDPDSRFTNIWLGSSDKMSQASLFRDSQLFKECEKGEWLSSRKLKASIDRPEIGEYIIGDAGYPLLPWLLTPYQENDLSDSRVEFNMRHSAARTVALKALARLKETWKCLHREMCRPENELCLAIYACCRLHNIVIDLEEARVSRDQQVKYSKQVRRLADEDAIRARDILSQHLISISSGGVEEKVLEIHPSISGHQEEDQQVVSRDKEEEEAHT